jgi:hypothetical protein
VINHQAGQFNTLVRIEQLDARRTRTLGSPAQTWTLFATGGAASNPVTGSEAFSDQADRGEGADLKLDGNFIAGVTAKMRVNDHGTYYDIRRRRSLGGALARYMTLLAKTGSTMAEMRGLRELLDNLEA